MSTYIIRQAIEDDIPGIASVRVRTWQSTYKGIVPDEYLNSQSIQEVSQRLKRNYWSNRKLGISIFIAENEKSEIIGFSICGPEEGQDPLYRGEIIALYVLPHFQKLGIGRKLVTASIQHLVNDLSITTMLIWVLADNKYRKFYESIGGEPVRKKDKEIGGRILPEVGYGWQDIDKMQ